MFSLSMLILGFAFIAMAAIMAIVWLSPEKKPQLSQKGKSAGNRKLHPGAVTQVSLPVMQDEISINLDAFADPELAVPQNLMPSGDALDALAEQLAMDDDDAFGETSHAISTMPQLRLASLMEVQQMQSLHENNTIAEPKPRILGDSACALGIRYFEHLLAHHSVPRGARNLTNESNILVAQNALKTSRQSVTLSHGAVAQRIGERAVCIFEPLETPVQHVDKAIELLTDVLNKKNIFIVLADNPDASPECYAHINAFCKAFNIPKSCVYIEQSDGAFFNYIEDAENYVPARIHPMKMPKEFFAKMLDYAHSAYDEGDHDAVLRTIEPFINPLIARVQQANFPKVLLAQALNLMGMTYREIGNDDAAISSFDYALNLLRKIEDYEAIKSVLANLGITLALARPLTQSKIERAIRHLNEVVQLNPRDDEAWLYLANSYLELYRMTNAQSLLRRANRAYEKAYELAPTTEIASCIEALNRQIGGRKAAANATAQQLQTAKSSSSQNAPRELER